MKTQSNQKNVWRLIREMAAISSRADKLWKQEVELSKRKSAILQELTTMAKNSH